MMSEGKTWKQELEAALRHEDLSAIQELARQSIPRVIRFLTGQLYSDDPETKWRAVRVLGSLAADPLLLDERRAKDLLQRFVWSLNDESGAVPYGIPEAMGELLAARSEFHENFLPILCSLLTESDMSQTGPIEQGAMWAVGRVGPSVAAHSSAAVDAVRLAAQTHPDPATREIAARSLEQIELGG